LGEIGSLYNVDTSSSSAGIYFLGLNNGYEFTVPADATQRTLRVYLGGWSSRSKVEAILSDGSALPYETIIDKPSGSITRRVTITYSAASSGQTLTLRHTLLDDYGVNGNIALQAATLQAGTISASASITGVTGAAPATINLTAEGTADWAKWGENNASDFLHKDGVTQQISYIAPFGASARPFLGKSAIWTTHVWSDGASIPFSVAQDTTNISSPAPVESIDNTKLTVTWTPNPESVDGYIVYFGPSASSVTNETTEITAFAGSFDPASPAIEYDSWYDLGLQLGDNVCFKLRAYNADGLSDWSLPACTTVPLTI
jgi:hypothetical protein